MINTSAGLMDIGEQIAEWAVSAICNHPTFVGWGLVVFFVATLVNTGIKGTWTYAEMPRWARFVLYFTMPLAFNFYHLAGKAGIQQPPTPGDVSASAVADAVKRQGL
jgi:hypothetical protein